jgi:BirA family biotin operon repressor/biotin-[acetyl-CoA-carboxylase] ligase
MEPLPAEFSVPLSGASGRLGAFDGRIRWYSDITSTNDVATALAEDGEGEGAVVVADGQTAGRGRLRRAWLSPHGAGIYASVILRPHTVAAPMIPLAAGVAIAEGIHAATGLEPLVKWPNDVMVADRRGVASARKVAGILAERGMSAVGASWVVLGFGINVRPAAYPAEVASRATSLESELGRSVERGLVLTECLAALSARYSELQHGSAASVVAAWRRLATATFGRPVEWDADGGVQHGIVKDVDESGALIVEVKDAVVRVIAGEVRWK